MATLISTLPAIPLTWECSVVWEARDPTTGDLVSGVIIDSPVLYGLNLTPTQSGTTTSVLVPPLTPLNLNDQGNGGGSSP